MNGPKIITASEALGLSARGRVESRGGHLSGLVTMFDEGGRLIFSKRPNVIVLGGRTFALELLFGSNIGSSGRTASPGAYVSDGARTVIAFGVGNGGAPGGSPFTPYAPPPNAYADPAGVQLASPIPFRFHDTSQSGSGDPTLFIPSGEQANYGGATPVPGGTVTQFHYYIKRFDVLDPVWYYSEADNTVYKSVALSVTAYDCRTAVLSGSPNQVNELCLYHSKITGSDGHGSPGGEVFANTEMFSRITFPTEFLSVGKALQIEYRIYA
jgi:hypothetical protein